MTRTQEAVLCWVVLVGTRPLVTWIGAAKAVCAFAGPPMVTGKMVTC